MGERERERAREERESERERERERERELGAQRETKEEWEGGKRTLPLFGATRRPTQS